MSMEHTQLMYARPQMLAERARQLVRAEAAKGCRPEIAPEPVALEPPYRPILAARDAVESEELWTPEAPTREADLVRHQIWIPPHQGCDWKRSERFLKQLSSVSHRLALEILGNRQGVRLQMLCHQEDEPILRTTFLAEFDQCELSPVPLGRGLRKSGSQWKMSPKN